LQERKEADDDAEPGVEMNEPCADQVPRHSAGIR
jgi:hypothetical protein